MSDNKFSLEDLFSSDNIYDYEDEKLASNIYYTSFSTSLRKLAKIYSTNTSLADELKKENDWLLGKLCKAQVTPVINFDKLPVLCNVDGLKSPDALLLNYDDQKLNLLIEFKKCPRSTLINKYINLANPDSIHLKLFDAKRLLTNILSIQNFSNDEIIEKTHIVIVYDGKNDMISYFPHKTIDKTTSTRNIHGKQAKATKLSFLNDTHKNNPEEAFSRIVRDLGYATCDKYYFPIPGRPDFQNEKPKGRVRHYSLFSSQNFIELIEQYNFFENINWGIYRQYLFPEDVELCATTELSTN